PKNMLTCKHVDVIMGLKVARDTKHQGVDQQMILSVRGVSEDVQRALRVRDAETGETIGQIVERALRRELGMMDRYTCYACDGDYPAGFWLSVDGSETFYCTSCAIKHDVHDSPHARPQGDVEIWQAWLHD